MNSDVKLFLTIGKCGDMQLKVLSMEFTLHFVSIYFKQKEIHQFVWCTLNLLEIRYILYKHLGKVKLDAFVCRSAVSGERSFPFISTV